ncbi:hypothetical protein AG0111_0g6219 [Alternaria gaisen]|uniref:Uncharacterized protein n=1 Tax=Alternaria gaisen TaxID=167740 RepID=A0ACB6FNP8_9PLEO|nr:hypothetical protein AG0111_0g6219 [Alternaria gaisen]
MATPAVAEPLAPTPKLLDLSGGTIAVQVGNEVVHVHECLVGSSSEFFKNATKPERRTESRPIDLSDEQPFIFMRYCQWLYSGLITSGFLGERSFQCLAYMYVLGEEIVDHEFQNAVIQAIISDMSQEDAVPGMGTIKIIYDGTTEESVARRLLVDSWACTMNPSCERFIKDLLEPDYKPFLKDLLPQILKMRLLYPIPTAKPWISEPESYYSKASS